MPTVFMLGVAAWACGEPRVQDVGSPALTDSAGVEVRTLGSAGFTAGGSDVSISLVYRVGWDERDPQFAWLDDGRILRDGRVLVFDETLHEFFVIGRTGEVEHRFGHQGDGPGDYQSASALHLFPGDSVLVYDLANRRVSVLDPEFAFVRSFRWTGGEEWGDVLARLAPSGVTGSGHLVWTPYIYGLLEAEEQARWYDGPAVIGPPEEGDHDSVMWLPLLEAWSEDGQVTSAQFEPSGWISGHPEGVIWARNDRPELRWYSEDGALTRVARWAQVPIEVTDQVWSDYVQGQFERVMAGGGYSKGESGLRRDLEDSRDRAAPTLPLFENPLVGSDGSVWLAEYHRPVRPPRRFLQVGPTGDWIRRIETPAPMTLLDGTGDLVLGFERNDLDVQALVLYRIER